MRCRPWTSLFVSIGMTLAASPVHAQSPLSLDASAGLAKVAGAGFLHEGRSIYEVGLDVSPRSGSRNQLLVGLSSGLLTGFHPVTFPAVLCVRPTGCPVPPSPVAPDFDYVDARLGARHLAGSRGTIDVTAGLALVHVVRPVRGDRGAVTVDLDGAVRLVGPLEVVGAAQCLSWSEGDRRLYIIPITLGFRLN